MNLKVLFYSTLFALILSFASCLGDSNDTVYTLSSDAEIYSFSLTHDSISQLKNADSTKFSIDQVNGLIYNADSLRCGTKIDRKLVMTYSGGVGILNITNGDSTWIASGDSVDFAQPVKLKVWAADGVSTKLYTAEIRIHNIDPDSIQYKKIKDSESNLDYTDKFTVLYNNRFYTYVRNSGVIQLYQSTDAISWTDVTSSLNGMPAADVVVKNIRVCKDDLYVNTASGELYVSEDAVTWTKVTSVTDQVLNVLGGIETDIFSPNTGKIVLIVRKDGENIFASFDNNGITYGTEVPDDFPVKSVFVSFVYEKSFTQRLVVVGGYAENGSVLNTVWNTTSSEAGLSWGKLSQDIGSSLLEGLNAFYYDSKILVMNGKLLDGSLNQMIYYSEDGGISWKKAPNKYLPPLEYTWRYDASLCVDKENYFYILGGKNQNNNLLDIWKIRMNRLGF